MQIQTGFPRPKRAHATPVASDISSCAGGLANSQPAVPRASGKSPGIAPGRSRTSLGLRSAALAATFLVASTSRGDDEPASVAGSAEALEEIVVTATRTRLPRADAPASIAVVDLEEARRDGFTHGTDEFRGVPGVFFRRGEGDGDEFSFVSIRGSTGTEGYLAMIDGIPFMGLDEEPLLHQVPYDAVERVEIVKGPVSALYGRGGLYGAVNYLTREPGEGGSSVSASAGSYDYYRVDGVVERASGDDAGMLISASYENAGGWREHGGRELLSLFGKLTHPLGNATRLSGYVSYADRDSELPNGLPVDGDGRVLDVAGGPKAFLGYGDTRNEQHVLIGALSLEHRLSEMLELAVNVQARRIEQSNRWNFYDPLGFDPVRQVYAINGFAGDTRQRVWYGEATLSWQHGRHKLIAGLAGERGEVDGQDYWSGQFGFTGECGFAFFLIEIDYTSGEIVNRDHPCFVDDLLYTSDHFRNRFHGAFLQDEIRLTDRLHLIVGARYDRFERTARFDPIEVATPGGTVDADADAFSPKVALSWRYDGGQVYASYGRGFSANFGPTFEWDAAQYARPEQKPSTLDSYEIGWKGQTRNGLLSFESAIFRTRQTNRRAIVSNPDAATDPTAPANLITYGQRYDSSGAELSVTLRPSGRTSLSANYTYLDPEWKDYVLSTFGGPVDLSGTTPVGVPEHMGNFSLEYRFSDWLTGRANLASYSDYMITQDNSVEGGGYSLLTLGARVEPAAWSNLLLDVTLINALDEEYYYFFGGRSVPTYATPGEPRQLRLTLRTSF